MSEYARLINSDRSPDVPSGDGLLLHSPNSARIAEWSAASIPVDGALFTDQLDLLMFTEHWNTKYPHKVLFALNVTIVTEEFGE